MSECFLNLRIHTPQLNIYSKPQTLCKLHSLQDTRSLIKVLLGETDVFHLLLLLPSAQQLSEQENQLLKLYCTQLRNIKTLNSVASPDFLSLALLCHYGQEEGEKEESW